ncbi:MAG: DNA primase [Chitinispirillaceae bacterium]|nr:DNA primase [Chitinispirillaceae bacterium]
MAGNFDDSAKEEVRLRADIVAVAGRYVKLRQSGATLKGLCPFHKEKTPSFHVNPSRQFFHCFGCGKGGDVFTFLQEIEGVTFPEALRMLAEETGVTLTKRTAQVQEATPAPALSKTEMLDLHKEAAVYYYSQIKNYPEVVDYFKERGLTAETVRDFRLGYAPPGWTSFIGVAEKKGIATEALVACGLAIKRDDGTAYDRFRDRIIFPLFDLSGRIVGFAGRGRTSDAVPKYLNSPETLLYRKKEYLYGLNMTRQQIKDQKYAIVVEGYMDYLTMYQAGITNVVATSGTALTPEHGHLLKRFAPQLVLVFDGDEAGQAAAQRGVVTLGPLDLEVSVLVLPPDEDPDSLVKKQGASGFHTLLEKAEPGNRFVIEKTIAEVGSPTPRGQKAVIEQLAPFEASMTNTLARSAFKKELAERLGIDEKSVYQVVRRAGSSGRAAAVPVQDDALYLRTLEGSFLHLLFTTPSYISEAGRYISPDMLTDRTAADIYSILLEVYGTYRNLEAFLDRVGEGDTRRLASRMLVTPALAENSHDELVQKIIYLRKKHLKSRIRENRIRLKTEADPSLKTDRMRRIQEDLQQLKELEEGE